MEKSKITAKDLMNLYEAGENLPMVEKDQGYGYTTFDYPETVSLAEQMMFCCMKYNKIAKENEKADRLTGKDFYVQSFKGKPILILHKSGKIKIGNIMGFKKNIPVIEERDNNHALVKQTVYFEGCPEPKTGYGLCERSEKGKEAVSNNTILKTALSRAYSDALTYFHPIDWMDEITFEEAQENIAQQIEQQEIKQIEKKTQEAQEALERETTHQEEEKLANNIEVSKRKFDKHKKTSSKLKDLLNSDEYLDGPPDGVDV